jgi:hypothetical protein
MCLSITHSFGQGMSEVLVDSIVSDLTLQFKDKAVSRIAVLDFTQDAVTTKLSLSITEQLKLKLANRNRSIQIVERNYIDRILEEQRLGLNPLFDETKAVDIGKLVSADAIVTGILIEESGDVRCNVKIVKVETGVLIGGVSILLGTPMSLAERPVPSVTEDKVLIPIRKAVNTSDNDYLLLMNGREIVCHILADTGTVFLMQLSKPNGRLIEREIHKNEVFSVTMRGETEEILYMQDEMLGNIYSVDEMRYYLAGENDARQNFKAWPTFAVGFALCAGVSVWGGDGYITAVGPPILFTLLQLAPKIKIREKTMSHPEYKYNDIYADGYEPPARTRKLSRAMEGAFLGSATGVAYWLLFLNK